MRRLVLVLVSLAVAIGLAPSAAVGDPPTSPTVTPSSQTLEATGPSGAVASFSAAATDDNDAPVVACAPSSGVVFPIGTTFGTCTFTDPVTKEQSTASFTVTVRDSIPPTFTQTSESVEIDVNGASATTVDYAEPTASDNIDGPVPVSCAPESGSQFKLGSTAVTCTATDSHGNSKSLSFRVRVRDTIPPPWVERVESKVSGTTAVVNWRLPTSTDVAGAVVARTPGLGAAARSIVYRGPATSFTDRGLKRGVTYDYEVSTYDLAQNRSAAVRAFARVAGGLLVEPFDGEQLTAPPLLTWKAVAQADYYNVQIWAVLRGGEKKVLSIWPTENQLQLPSKWSFQGVRYGLAKGTYRWYVWPGVGRIALARYGKLLGSNTFVIVS
jgi:hypothetical protein